MRVSRAHRRPGGRRFVPLSVLACLTMATSAACAPSSTPAENEPEAAPSPVSEEDFDLDALIAAAKEEDGITIYDSTGKIEEMAANFTATYGIPAEGIKQDSSDIVEKVTRESEAGNVTADVAVIGDIASVKSQLMPQGIVENWVPPDLAADIPAEQHDPLIMIHSPTVVVYNTEVHDSCPIDNIWALADPELRGDGGLVMQDPLNEPDYPDWWSQMSAHRSDDLAAAYEELYGTPLALTEPDAGREFVKRFAASKPLLMKGDEESSEAVGAPGQDNPPIGLMSTAKLRNVDELGYALGLCEDLTPFSGFAKPKAIVMATGTESPNAARLFIHFALTEEGIAPQTADGKISSNTAIPASPDDPVAIAEKSDQIFFFSNETVDEDWADRQALQDLWRVNFQ